MIKVLVLDDEKGLCEDMKEFFAYRGYKVFAATSGEQAVSIIKKENIDILVLDIKMEGIDGLKVLKMAKEKDTKGFKNKCCSFGTDPFNHHVKDIPAR